MAPNQTTATDSAWTTSTAFGIDGTCNWGNTPDWQTAKERPDPDNPPIKLSRTVRRALKTDAEFGRVGGFLFRPPVPREKNEVRPLGQNPSRDGRVLRRGPRGPAVLLL